MLDADDVINLTAEERIFFADMAVFAPVIRAFGYQSAKFSADIATHEKDVGVRGPWLVSSDALIVCSGLAQTSPPG